MDLYKVDYVVTSEDGDENADHAYMLCDTMEQATEEVELTYSEDEDVTIRITGVVMLASDDDDRPTSVPLVAFAATED